MFGETFLSVTKIIDLIFKPYENNTQYIILSQIRFPRTIATYFVGAGLAIVGCVLQSVFLNPLCEGYTIGISSAAALGVIVGFMLNLPLGRFNMSVLGVLSAIGFIYLMNSFIKRTIDIGFVLSGVVLNFLFSSIIIFLTLFFDPYRLNSTLLWLLGGFSNVDSFNVYISVFIIGVCIIFIIFFSDKLDILILGKEKAESLGVNSEKTKKWLIFLSVIITTFCVSVAGVIAFVGIIVPNIVKKFVGLKHKDCIIYSGLVGALFISISDNVAKNILYPVEIPIGVLTGILGSIIFVFYLLRDVK